MNCSSCNGPMVPMISSWFCPKDCDRLPSVTTVYRGKVWNVSLIHAGQNLPPEATHGWCLTSHDSGLSGYSRTMSLQQVMARLQEYDIWKNSPFPGWEMRDNRWRFTNGVSNSGMDFVVFWEKK